MTLWDDSLRRGVVYGRASIGGPTAVFPHSLREGEERNIIEGTLRRKIGEALLDAQARDILSELYDKASLSLSDIIVRYRNCVPSLSYLTAAWLVDVDSNRVRLTEQGAEIVEYIANRS